MWNINGKLSGGKSFRAQVPVADAGKAVNTVVEALPEGVGIVSMTIKPAEASGFVKIAATRARKAKIDNGTGTAATADSGKKDVGAPANASRKR